MDLNPRPVNDANPLAPNSNRAWPAGGDPPFSRFSAPTAVQWTTWLRLIERKRRAMARMVPKAGRLSAEFLARLTTCSFRLEGLAVDERQVANALVPHSRHRAVRSRLVQRLRNHVAILRRVERALRRGTPLKPSAVVRWYTSVSCGLSTTGLDDTTMGRLDALVRRINSPRPRLQPALQDVARVHACLMADPLVPSFNGILARMLLGYHLGRCGLPPVLFDAASDAAILSDEPRLLTRLLDLIDAGYTLLLAGG